MVYNVRVTRKDEWLTKIRVSAEEKQVIVSQAEREGLSLTSWMRYHLLRLARQNQAQNGPVKTKKAKKAKAK